MLSTSRKQKDSQPSISNHIHIVKNIQRKLNENTCENEYDQPWFSWSSNSKFKKNIFGIFELPLAALIQQLLKMLDFLLPKKCPLIANIRMDTPLNNATDLRVIGVGRTRATNKFQNEATILPAYRYRKSVNQDQIGID